MRVHAGNVMDVARIASQGYNGRRARKSRSDGRSDRSSMQKSGLNSLMNLCRANSGEKERRGIGRSKNIRMLVRENK